MFRWLAWRNVFLTLEWDPVGLLSGMSADVYVCLGWLELWSVRLDAAVVRENDFIPPPIRLSTSPLSFLCSVLAVTTCQFVVFSISSPLRLLEILNLTRPPPLGPNGQPTNRPDHGDHPTNLVLPKVSTSHDQALFPSFFRLEQWEDS